MEKFILTIGLNDKDTKQPKYDIITAYKLVENVLKQYVDGYTIYQTQGGYKHIDNTFITETSLRVELMFTTTNVVKTICNKIKSKDLLNQETIALEIVTSNSQLI
jgi:hypothetical protein